MAHLFRPVAVKPVPRNATIATVNGVRVARWTARGGRKIVAPLTPDGAKCRVESPNWWIEYRSATRPRERVPGFRDRQLTMRYAVELESQARDVAAGVDRAPDRGGNRTLADHLEDFADHLRRKGDDARHVRYTVRQVQSVVAGVPLSTPGSADRAAVERWLDGEQRRLSWGARTRNSWAGSLNSFGRWLVREGRAKFNPFDGLARANVERDRRRVRRALDPDDLARLVVAARDSPAIVRGLSGPDRAMLYAVAAMTGRRLGALKKMTTADIVREGGTPAAISTGARLQKSKKPHVVPLQPEFAAEFGAWLASRPASGLLWSGWVRWADRGADMIRHDLAVARAAWIAEAGKDKKEMARREASDRLLYADHAGEVFDFHALRGQFISSLAWAGVDLTAAQELADHSDPKLTANVYTKWKHRLAGEVKKLPGLGVRLGSGLGPLGSVSGGNKRHDRGKNRPPETKKRQKQDVSTASPVPPLGLEPRTR